MNVDSIRAYCLSFPEVTEKLQWGDALCFKVRQKMFAVLGLDQIRLTFKCTPEIFVDLVEREDVAPAPYVGRYKWIILNRLDALRTDELRELLRESYEMVAAKAPTAAVRKRGAGTRPIKKTSPQTRAKKRKNR